MRCMYCGHTKTHKRGKTTRGKKKYQRYICSRCQKSFSELTGTIYEDRHLAPTDIDKILECQNQGMNFTQVAKKVGVTPKAVSKILKDNTLKISDLSDHPVDPFQSLPDVTTDE